MFAVLEGKSIKCKALAAGTTRNPFSPTRVASVMATQPTSSAYLSPARLSIPGILRWGYTYIYVCVYRVEPCLAVPNPKPEP